AGRARSTSPTWWRTSRGTATWASASRSAWSEASSSVSWWPGMTTAIVVGSGPNGLAAAIVLARAGWDVTVLEANDTIGGGMRSAELTVPGLVHDVCSAAHPTGVASPFLQSLQLDQHGLE